jgi:dTDP-4-amino-4,6-dideoxygalactose transaminase
MVGAHRLAYRPSTYWTVRSLFRSLSSLGVIRGNYNKVGHSARPAADFKRRMGGLQRSRLRRELEGLATQTAHRRKVATEYRRRILPTQVAHPPIAENVDAVFSRYPMFVEDKRGVLESARRARVELAGFYDSAVQPLRGEALSSVGYQPGSCPNAEWAAERIVSLPTGLLVGEKQVDRAVDFLNQRGIVAGP